MQNWTCAIKLKDIDYSGGYVDMDKYNELNNEIKQLKNQIDDLQETINNIKPQIYNTIEDIADWARPTINKLIDSGYIKGTESGLNISYDFLRTLVILDRIGIIKEKE